MAASMTGDASRAGSWLVDGGFWVWARHRPVAAFFALTFTYSWGLYLPAALQGMGLVELGLGRAGYTALNIMGGFGPCLAGAALTQNADGLGGVKLLLVNGLDVRGVSPSWLLSSPLLFPGLNLGSAAVNYTLTGVGGSADGSMISRVSAGATSV